MKTKEQSIKVLQQILSGLIGGSQQHYMHATINEHKGYTKLADKMMAEFKEETAEIATFANRILELGGTPSLDIVKYEVYADTEQQLREECKLQSQAVPVLEEMIASIENDTVTENLLSDYIDDENEHAQWLKRQVDLIDAIGIQNYLAAQL